MNTINEKFDLRTTGKDSGAGTFARGELTGLDDGRIHVAAASERGYRFRTVVDTVYVGYQKELTLDVLEEEDVSGMEFRLGDDELHLREPVE